ncbi:MAG: class I SAM-dependent methyltransferase [Tannerella sp.]|jgi:SAM-dependent methyltransferase|nr:class I SAM-dependent methyltransferase [Tannerella sp.]
MKKLNSLIKKHMPAAMLKALMRWHYERRGRRNARRYRGEAVTCPCCGETFRAFMDFECSDMNNAARYAGYGANTVCPRCASFPRHRVACCYFDENRERLGERILMFGAERSIEKWFRRNGFRYTTADLFDRTAEIRADIEATPFADGHWSLIVCNHVLEHVPDYKAALKELRRILATDGILEISVPTDRRQATVCEDARATAPEQRIARFGQADHLRIFGSDVEAILTAAGFAVEAVCGDALPPAFRAVVGPADYDDNRIYVCRKEART